MITYLIIKIIIIVYEYINNNKKEIFFINIKAGFQCHKNKNHVCIFYKLICPYYHRKEEKTMACNNNPIMVVFFKYGKQKITKGPNIDLKIQSPS